MNLYKYIYSEDKGFEVKEYNVYEETSDGEYWDIGIDGIMKKAIDNTDYVCSDSTYSCLAYHYWSFKNDEETLQVFINLVRDELEDNLKSFQKSVDHLQGLVDDINCYNTLNLLQKIINN